MNHEQLNTLLNTWEEGTYGHLRESEIIEQLDAIGKKIGYAGRRSSGRFCRIKDGIKISRAVVPECR